MMNSNLKVLVNKSVFITYIKETAYKLAVQPPYNIPQLKVFAYLTFNFNDPKAII